MKRLLLIFLLFIIVTSAIAQTGESDFSLKLTTELEKEYQGWLYLPKKQQIVTFLNDSARFIDIETGKTIKTVPPMKINRDFYHWKLSPDEEKLIASGFLRKDAELWDIANGKLIAAIPKQKKEIWVVEWSPDSRFFLLLPYPYQWEKQHNVWDGATGKIKSSFATRFESFAQFSPDGKTILTTESVVKLLQDHLKLWETESGGFIREFPQQASYARFTPDGKLIIAKERDKIYCLEPETGEIKNTIADNSAFSVLKFSPNGKFLLIKQEKVRGVFKADETWFQVYDIETGKLKTELRTEKPEKLQVEINQIVWRPDSNALIAAGQRFQKQYEAESWDVSTGKSKFVLSPLIARRSTGFMESGYKDLDTISYTPDSKFLITENFGEKAPPVRIWDAETGKLVKSFGKGDERIGFTSDRKYLTKIKGKTLSIYEFVVK